MLVFVRNFLNKYGVMFRRLPRAICMAWSIYKMFRKAGHRVAWKNAKGYFKLALVWS